MGKKTEGWKCFMPSFHQNFWKGCRKKKIFLLLSNHDPEAENEVFDGRPANGQFEHF